MSNNTFTSRYDVAVILINYNSSRHTIECVNSIIKHTGNDTSYQIVIIDNASDLDDFMNLSNYINSLHDADHITLVRSKINTGFSGGNMLGVHYASSNYYFFLNNDCILKNDCLTLLKNHCEENINVAICSPQLVRTDGSIEPCFDYFPTLITKFMGIGILKFTRKKGYYPRKIAYQKPINVDVLSGSQMFIRKKHFNATGGFDTTFFLYCEEEDLAIRFNNRGYDAHLVPSAINFHAGGASTDRTLSIDREFYISFLHLYRKHYGGAKTFILQLYLALKLIKKSLRDHKYFLTTIFILRGAPLKYSLRHKQKILPE
ncbi:glycosyltransferase family 2 protein [Candidatus Pacearchaeota archaeon]|nr:glycosyltransferase family 2 protein [Candidatus Pacearchaeota archaeon]